MTQRMQNAAETRDRRREPRVQVGRRVYLEAADARTERFEEVRTTRDAGRYGFYFVTSRAAYQPGMRVHSISAIGGLGLEYSGEVVRVERLPGGEFGVAIHLLRVRHPVARVQAAAPPVHRSFTRVDAAQEPAHRALP